MANIPASSRRPSASRRPRSAAGLKNLLVRLGPDFIRAGQALALKPDVIPEEFFSELLTLTDTVPAFPPDDARRIIAERLGPAADDLLRAMDWRPAVVGAFSQVYVARTPDGAELAVKVRRPGVG